MDYHTTTNRCPTISVHMQTFSIKKIKIKFYVFERVGEMTLSHKNNLVRIPVMR
jgi:hypothetical protein